MLPTIHQILFYIHVFCGSVGLVIFWLPMIARKGSRFHIIIGKIFTNGMLLVSVSGLFMSTFLLLDPIGVRFPEGGLSAEKAQLVIDQNRTLGIFLLMLSLLVFVNVKHSVMVLKAKSNRNKLKSIGHMTSITALLLTGVGVGLLAIGTDNLLFGIFSLLSIMSSIGLFRYIFKDDLQPREWVIEHLTNIIGSGIGAYTAFFAFGGRRFLGDIFSGSLQILPWVLPGILGAIASVYLARKYRALYRVS